MLFVIFVTGLVVLLFIAY